MSPAVWPGVACNLDSPVLSTILPLLEAGEIEALEWSFDTLFGQEDLPEWFVELLRTFSASGRLVGHGVFFSIFKAKWSDEQSEWLRHLQQLCRVMAFDHISEHFGFMTGEDFHKGAPMSVPLTKSALTIGIDRLQRIQDACNCPVGLENLAFAFCRTDVQTHGDFLDRLLDPVNGFIILDLHNLYCQAMNFDVPPDELISYYPLHRVREIHISGGSWEESTAVPGRRIRRDTHNDAVPEEVFAMLGHAFPLCPNVKYVMMEQIGGALQTVQQQTRYRADYMRMKRIVERSTRGKSPGSEVKSPFHTLNSIPPITPLEDSELYSQQTVLAHILENAPHVEEARMMLRNSSLANSAWSVESWPDHMLETALRIAQKWKDGWPN